MRADETFFNTFKESFLVAPEAPKVEEQKEAAAEPAVKPITQKNLFANPDTHPVVLDFVLLKQFGTTWFSWLPDTVLHEIEREFKTSIAEINKIKLLAAKTLHVSDAFWDHWEVFEKMILALNGLVPRMGVMQPPDVPLLMSGIDIANTLRKETFNEEVSRYTAACFLYNELQYAPEPCDFCQQYISQPTYKCNVCGKVGSALPPFDGYCDSCTQRYEHETPLSLKPDPVEVAKGYGKDLTYRLTHDPLEIKARYEELLAMPPDTVASHIKETAEDVQSARLIIAYDYMTAKKKQLTEQLTNFKGWLGA
jgi:hypothetical protein